MAGLKGIWVAISLTALLISMSVFAIPTPGDISTSVVIVGGRPVSDFSSNPERFIETGILGNVSIGPTQPVCYVPQNGTSTVPYPSNSDEVVVTSQSGEQTSIPVSWFLSGGCELWGSFKAGLAPGNYSLTLSYCLLDPRYAGCPQSLHFGPSSLPITVHVERGRLTPINIGIDTGIR